MFAQLQSFQFGCSIVSSSLWPYGLQHTRSPCLSPSPRACSNLCPWSQWCHPTTSSSVVPFCSRLQSFPASAPFAMFRFFASGGCSLLEFQLQHRSFQWTFRVDSFKVGWFALLAVQAAWLRKVRSVTWGVTESWVSVFASICWDLTSTWCPPSSFCLHFKVV